MLSKLWSPSVQIVAQSSHCEEYLEQNWSTLQVLVPHLAPLKVIAASTVLSLTSGISSTADTANNIILRRNVLLAMDDINCTGVINSQVRHSRFLSLLFFPALNSFVWLDGMLFAQTRLTVLSSIVHLFCWSTDHGDESSKWSRWETCNFHPQFFSTQFL